MYEHSGSNAGEGIKALMSKRPPEPLPQGDYAAQVAATGSVPYFNEYVIFLALEIMHPGPWDGSIICMSSGPATDPSDIYDFLKNVGDSISNYELPQITEIDTLCRAITGQRTILRVHPPTHPAQCDDLSYGPISLV